MKLCPECLTPLEHKIYKIFHTWVCPEGHGTLYPKGELEAIVKALSGLGDLEVKLWDDHERYVVVQSPLMSPSNDVPMWEIRDVNNPTIMVYGDPVNHDLWVHIGEEEKLVEHLEIEASSDSVATYLKLAGEEALKIFDDETPFAEAAGHTLASLKLLGDRILRAFPYFNL